MQGEENITSAAISQDGGLLAISTTSNVKLFQLNRPQSGAGATLRIRKLDMPLVTGTTNLKLSANGKWLAAVSATDDIQLVRIVRTDDASDAPRALDKTQHLHRLDRDDLPKTSLHGPSGSYERSIAHAQFSTDGNAFAVVDLAGYVDTWVVEGHEDPTAPEVDITDATQPVRQSEESDEEEDDGREEIVFLGQHWIRNPSAHIIPRLDSTPVLLSFQPGSNSAEGPEPNGNPAVHPTRHNPHPHSHELPKTEYRLLLVSAEHQIYLIDMMAGRLSEWSRRNPPSSYPIEYRQLDLPAKGCIWDVSDAQQRIWLYGEKWLFMFDLSKDLSISGSESKKRKWNGHKSSSGAGDAMHSKDTPVTKMRKFDGVETSESDKSRWIDANAAGQAKSDGDEDEMEDVSQPLAILRRGNTQDDEQTKGEGDSEAVVPPKRDSSWWHTFKYRPILGILPVGTDVSQSPEVVLVERPSWDLDLPPRFVGSHEQ